MAAEALATRPLLLEARGVEVRYGAVAAVSGFDLRLAAGEIVGLTGVSGSGKSSAAYALLGLARPPGRITAGEVRIGGRDVLALPPAEQARHRGRDVSLVVQNPRAALHPMLPIGAQIARIWRTHADGERGGGRARAAVVDLLRSVGINAPEQRAQAFVHELSGGMAQRAVIAAALAANPRVLVADEPTSGLDVTVQAQFLDLIGRAVRERGSALLLVTQEPGVLANYCDRVLVMDGGRLVEELNSDDYRARQRAASVGRIGGHEDGRRRGDGAAGGSGRDPGTGSAREANDPDRASAGSPVDAVLRVRTTGLHKRFRVGSARRELHAVQDVSFAIGAGETLGLVGESGSGKSTVGRCLLGLEAPSAGTVEFESVGALVGGRLPRSARAQLQLVRQDPYDSFDPRWTLGRSLREPLDLHSDATDEEKQRRILHQLHLVGCDPRVIHRRPREVGGGTLQRINVARAFLGEPRFVVLDEPTSLLAPDDRRALVDVLRRLQSTTGVSYLFISHDLATVRALCHRVAVMYLGQIVELARTATIFDAPRHPYTRALIDAYLDPRAPVRRVDRPAAAPLAGDIPSPLDLPPGCHLATRCPHALDRCRSERQELAALAPAHDVRCWRAPGGTTTKDSA